MMHDLTGLIDPSVFGVLAWSRVMITSVTVQHTLFTHTDARARTHTRTHTYTHTHTLHYIHTHTRARTHARTHDTHSSRSSSELHWFFFLEGEGAFVLNHLWPCQCLLYFCLSACMINIHWSRSHIKLVFNNASSPLSLLSFPSPY